MRVCTIGSVKFIKIRHIKVTLLLLWSRFKTVTFLPFPVEKLRYVGAKRNYIVLKLCAECAWSRAISNNINCTHTPYTYRSSITSGTLLVILRTLVTSNTKQITTKKRENAHLQRGKVHEYVHCDTAASHQPKAPPDSTMCDVSDVFDILLSFFTDFQWRAELWQGPAEQQVLRPECRR